MRVPGGNDGRRGLCRPGDVRDQFDDIGAV
ncbi:MAG: hypothetical protein QOC85_2935, partial [Streptomyces sp.]|nr:hypothetical protein [Streptomyces sp.]